jgi:steroid delta-isomerase-like uncharacterized protein
MTPEQNKALYNRYIQEVFNKGRLELLDELLSPSYVYHDAPPGTPEGPEAIRQVVTMFRTGFPDLEITLEAQAAEGEDVCSRSVMRGTHTGTVFGLAPTGNKVEMKGITWVRVRDGRITDSWVRNDVATMMRQLNGGAA